MVTRERFLRFLDGAQRPKRMAEGGLTHVQRRRAGRQTVGERARETEGRVLGALGRYAEGSLSGLRRFSDAIDPMQFMDERDVAGFLPGAGMVEGYDQMGQAAQRVRDGDYLGAAGDYALGAFNAVGDMIPAMSAVPPVRRTFYHGTGADISALDDNRILYMTDNADEAGAYARGGHLGGTAGEPRIYEIDVAEGHVRNIDDALFDAMDNGDDLEEVIMQAVRQARRDGVPYIEYMHPSAVGSEDHLVRIAVRPASMLKIRGIR